MLEQLARRSSVSSQEPRSATATPTGVSPRGPSGAQAGQATRGGARRDAAQLGSHCHQVRREREGREGSGRGREGGGGR